MNGGRKAFLLIFALNSISLYIYISFHNSKTQTENHSIPTENPHKSLTETHSSSLVSTVHVKPWPILPSYLPWALNPNVRTSSCEGYFGNGFNRRIDLIRSASTGNGGGGGGDGWFRCFYSETLESSICEGGGIRMNTEKIKMAVGGEKLEMVIGRSEEEEMPVFDMGAFDIGVNHERINGDRRKKLVNREFLDRFVPKGDVDKHTMRSLIDSIQLVDSDEFHCSQWIEEPTLLVTRFEYANVFHTFTDWYSAYVASRVTGVPNRPHLVFLDGHCKSQLEETWEALFSSVRYAKNFSGSVCFRHAILSPLGYETALFKGLSHSIHCQGAQAHDLWQNPDEEKTARLSEFGEMIRAAFSFPVERNRVAKPVSSHSILFVRREDYLAHPRHGGIVESRLSNEQEVFDAIKDWLDNHLNCEVSLINGLFAHMPMKEQVRAIQDASVIIGAHGAGLTHIVAAAPTAVVLELISSLYRRPHFALISQWKGLEYHAINLVGSYAEPEVVIDKLNSIMSSLGC